MRNWLAKQGKEKYIDFNSKERNQYKEIFDALDADGSKAIGVSELEDPLIALGFVANREDVQKLIDTVDEDGNGEIEFEEFLLIMKAIKGSGGNVDEGKASLYQFFQDMIEGNFSKRGEMNSDVPFMLNFSQYRRRRIIDAIMISDNMSEGEEQEEEDDEFGYEKSPQSKVRKEAIKAKELEIRREKKKNGQKILNVS